MENIEKIKKQIADRIAGDPELAKQLLKQRELEIKFNDIRLRYEKIAQKDLAKK